MFPRKKLTFRASEMAGHASNSNGHLNALSSTKLFFFFRYIFLQKRIFLGGQNSLLVEGNIGAGRQAPTQYPWYFDQCL